MSKRRITLAGMVFATLTLVAVACATTQEKNKVADGLETPKYEVKEKEGDFEVREYESYIVAYTLVKGTFDDASRDGFRRVAGYIFGGNTSNSKVAMTAPVATTKSSEKIAMTAPVSSVKNDDAWRIAFMMPSEYKLEDLPKPNDERVILEEVKKSCQASVRFSGFTTQKSIAKNLEALTSWMGKNDLVAAGPHSIDRFNDPFTLPWNRHNEILIPLECEK